MSNQRQRWGRLIVALTGASALLAGCAPSAAWNDADRESIASLQADPWLGPGSEPPPSREGESDHVGQYLRPTVNRYLELVGDGSRGNERTAYRDTLARELAEASASGWTPTFIRCSPGHVIVDVVKDIDGRIATGRLELTSAYPGQVIRSAILPDHRDGDALPAPDTSASADLDLSVCAEWVDEPTWSGLPTQYDRVGGPAVVD